MNYYERFNFDKRKDKGVMFFSASSYKDATVLTDNGIYEVLTSYHYIKKRLNAFTDTFLPLIQENDGLFMTDSGAFSFFHGEINPAFYTERFWIPYLEEYCEFLEKHHKLIYVAANLDLDRFLGRETIDKWDAKYFKPLEKLVQICYIAHGHEAIKYADKDGAKRVYAHCRKHKYVGIGSSTMVSKTGQDLKFASYARQTKARIHGFGWTQVPRLRQVPLFSVDSTTWLSAVRYGTTYISDGVNFKTVDHKHKEIRRMRQVLCEEHGIDHEAVLREDRDALHALNLLGWRGARNIFLKACATRLYNQPVNFYSAIR